MRTLPPWTTLELHKILYCCLKAYRAIKQRINYHNFIGLLHCSSNLLRYQAGLVRNNVTSLLYKRLEVASFQRQCQLDEEASTSFMSNNTLRAACIEYTIIDQFAFLLALLLLKHTSLKMNFSSDHNRVGS